ncbi:MAG TPA: N-acetyltransferase [Firmicutes bacterium]|nr:N-acetyltransferase [Bacillota bacterium]
MIEKAQFKDLEKILRLQKLAYLSEAEICNDYSIPPLVQTIDGMIEDFKNQLILKAILDSEIIGSIRAFEKEGTCYIGKVIVHPEHQNKGIGTELMKCMESHFKNCQRYELFTGKNSVRNLYFYNKLGYKIFREKQVNEKLTFVYMDKAV